jgi:hypothetical protein
MDIYKARNVLEYTKEMDDIKGTASSVAIDVGIKALDIQEKLQQFIAENDNHKFVRCDDWSKDSIIKLLKQFIV